MNTYSYVRNPVATATPPDPEPIETCDVVAVDAARVAELRPGNISCGEAMRLGEIFAALSEPTRLRILDALDEVAKRFDSNPARVSLAWLIARPGITAPIASATSLKQLDDLTEATRLELDQASIDLLNQASA